MNVGGKSEVQEGLWQRLGRRSGHTGTPRNAASEGRGSPPSPAQATPHTYTGPGMRSKLLPFSPVIWDKHQTLVLGHIPSTVFTKSIQPHSSTVHREIRDAGCLPQGAGQNPSSRENHPVSAFPPTRPELSPFYFSWGWGVGSRIGQKGSR